MLTDQPFQIAIDGPIAAGKGTVSLQIAKRLNFLYVDTGAMYRTAVLVAQQNNVDIQDEDALAVRLTNSDIQMRNPLPDEQDGRRTTVLLDGQDVSWKIRDESVGNTSSQVAKHKKIREVLVTKQQTIASNQNVVMEGRDITYRVLPNAQLKIYLTANELIRVQRRHLQLSAKGEDITFEEVRQNLEVRDYNDTHRVHDPLKIVPDAWVIDTSDLSIDQVVDMIADKAKALLVVE